MSILSSINAKISSTLTDASDGCVVAYASNNVAYTYESGTTPRLAARCRIFSTRSTILSSPLLITARIAATYVADIVDSGFSYADVSNDICRSSIESNIVSARSPRPTSSDFDQASNSIEYEIRSGNIVDLPSLYISTILLTICSASIARPCLAFAKISTL